MKTEILGKAFSLAVLFVIGCAFVLYASEKEEKEPQSAEQKPSVIEAGSGIDTNHPEIEEGLSCNDCHEIKLDAHTTATTVWLSGESPGRAAGEGVLPQEKVWEKVVAIIGGIKADSKTFVLATALNNEPLSTTAEFTLDRKKKVLYGLHEEGTEKLVHIRNNPKVSLNWHREFETFSDYHCVQIRGTAELIDGTSEEFERIMVAFLPYEGAARVPADATPAQREKRLKQFRQSLKKGFVISKITIDRATVATMDFVKDGFRRYQRWER